MSKLRSLTLATLMMLAAPRLETAAVAQSAPTGTVMVLGEPGAHILLDGQPFGQLPLRRPLPVAAGAHRLSIESSGQKLEAQIEVRAGRLLDVRFDRESGAVAVSQPPAALLLTNFSGAATAAASELQQAASRAMDDERLLRFDPAAAKPGSTPPADCTQLACQVDLATQNSLPYVVSVEAQPAAAAPADLRLAARLIDAAIGDAAAAQEKLCTGCSATQAAESLNQLVRLVIARGLARQRGKLEIRSQPAAATVELDGRPIGATPISRQAWAGSVELLVQHPGYLAERQRVVIQDGQTTNVELTLREPPKAVAVVTTPIEPVAPRFERQPRPRWRLYAGGATLGGGALFLGFGIGGLAVSGSCINPADPPAQQCEQLYATSGLGAGLTVVGAALAVTGGLLLGLPGTRRLVRTARANRGKGAFAYASTSANFGNAGQPGARRSDDQL